MAQSGRSPGISFRAFSVVHSDPLNEISSPPTPPVAAIVYADKAYPVAAFETVVRWCRGQDLTFAGLLQRQVCTTPDRRCDVVLEDLVTGHRTAMFEDRGSGATGCRLDEAALAEVTALIEGNRAWRGFCHPFDN